MNSGLKMVRKGLSGDLKSEEEYLVCLRQVCKGVREEPEVGLSRQRAFKFILRHRKSWEDFQ